jgi:hypothetical protein
MPMQETRKVVAVCDNVSCGNTTSTEGVYELWASGWVTGRLKIKGQHDSDGIYVTCVWCPTCAQRARSKAAAHMATLLAGA